MDHIHVHLHLDGDFHELARAIAHGFEKLGVIVTLEGTHMSQALDDLTAEVAAVHGVVDSAITLIQGLRQQIIDAGTDPAKLQALTDDLHAQEVALSAAVATTP